MDGYPLDEQLRSQSDHLYDALSHTAVRFLAGAALGMSLSYTLTPKAATESLQPQHQESILTAECNEAEKIAAVDQYGQESVIVRLDCVPEGKASGLGAVVFDMSGYPNGLIQGERVPDGTILGAVCRQVFKGESKMNLEVEGESEEWVKLSAVETPLTIDDIPYFEYGKNVVTGDYVNAAYVVGEKSLPDCGPKA